MFFHSKQQSSAGLHSLHVLVVDDDPLCLMVLERMLKQCSYNVTTCNRVKLALQLLRENRDEFDLVLSDVYMPDEDGFKLLEVIGLELDLPVIMMSANGETSVVMQGITHGACDYLIKPIRIEELRNIWQHVIRRKGKEIQRGSMQGELDEVSKVLESQDQTCKKRKESFDMEDCSMDWANSLNKKARVNWSMELHRQFVDAVNELGIDKAVPKRILEIMNVQGLTRENVASHLQKYRLYLKRLSGVVPEPCPIASFQASGDGTTGGTMLVQPAGKAPLPTVGVKGRNLGAGIGSGPAKDKKIDVGTLESLAKYKVQQQQQVANRAQILGGLGLSDPRSMEVPSSGLHRMCSLDLSFLLQAQSIESFTEQRADAVDDLAACNFRKVKLEEDAAMSVSGVNNKRTYPARHGTGRPDHIGQSSAANDEKKCKKVEAAAGVSEMGMCSDTWNFESGGHNKTTDSVPGYMDGVAFNLGLTNEFGDRGLVGRDKLLRGSSGEYAAAAMGVHAAMAAGPNKQQHDFPQTIQIEQREVLYGHPGAVAYSNTMVDLADLVDDAVSSTNVERSTVSSATDISGDTFSESSFGALAQLSGMMSPPPPSHSLSQATPNVELDISDYLQLDDGFGF
ncbi:hypothetical protein GOP47_0011096 [Adiantum capillus-veneris]|uniref:Two-component response regulator n=1 Tax=Adiantum capillus-veneris TaxID=13818 RepID=A0A9D4UTI2_ADICA|nr:hypothetical protein GOP47_0011096 [Adiantum capillus-veneris]